MGDIDNIKIRKWLLIVKSTKANKIGRAEGWKVCVCDGGGELSLDRAARKLLSLAFSQLQIHCATLGKSLYRSELDFLAYTRVARMSYGIKLL